MIPLLEDIRAIYRHDPACRNLEFLLYPSLHVITVHRIVIHPLYRLGMPFLPRMFSQLMRFFTGIEIHPGAKIGSGFFCDHGCGVVIGETVEIGRNCTLFHGVTLGGTGKAKRKRHPTIGDHVYIGHGVTILGPVMIGSNSKIGAQTVIVNRDVPEHCTVIGSPPKIIKLAGNKTEIDLPVSDYRYAERQQEGNEKKTVEQVCLDKP
ncbi:serine acetyltransferase|uniref:Serine acetyltransferase n=1 Tax=Dendrosporobacter quercicolus TaxID=146817 RepID=A0A1G9RRK0_9FIRM|nr:serine O-acetyltransferase EpsC [Dendrosporobacter quercicolus]NSL49372.1 serine acetyltransferase [Dendrosporobacter quercicolus DSM 1736]SDM25826.1 serine O-acetyltransferase [Dendrosporobacter quercicolus]